MLWCGDVKQLLLSGQILAAFNLSGKNSSSAYRSELCEIEILYLRCENVAFPVKLKWLNQVCGLGEGSIDERITETCTVTIVKFYDSQRFAVVRLLVIWIKEVKTYGC